ncbi:class I SAM-dependent methyltransferase [Kibdelosporangium aridum]|uniref:class I SAM-dependent methyltransferase n=1 Tax=Kibdelosporangium aridum TaxID=2030 RepID=UPI0035E779E0
MYDEGYQRWRASARHLALFGEGLPDSIQPFSFVPMQGMEFVSSLLALSPGSTLVDFGCGRGGPGMWLAAQAGAGVIGVDSSKVAVADAASRQDLFPGLASARFVVADVADTGLPSGCADAVVSIDVLQLVPDPVAMVREITRVLKPGGRVVVTTWENTGAEVERFPSDIPGLFTEMSDVEVYDRPEWLPRQYAIYDAAVEADDGTDPAIADLAKEAKMIEPLRENSRRLVVTASRR